MTSATDATLAISLPLTGVGPAEGVELAGRAAGWGYQAAWVSEVQGPDAFSQLGALAVTTDLELGVAVVPTRTRTAMVLGMSAVTVAQMSGGRFTLGIGASSETIVSDWAGQSFEAPLTHVRETVDALRPILRGERAKVNGRFVSVGGYRPHAPPPAPVPLYVGALNPRSLRQTGAIADGVCLNQIGPDHLRQLLGHVRAGAEEAGRDIDFGAEGFGVMARIFCAVTDDVDAARGLVKAVFAPYVATSVYNRFYRSLGYQDEADAVLEAAEQRDRDAMAAALSDELVDDIFVLGTPDEVAAGVRAYADAGIGVLAVHPLSFGVEQAEQTLRAVADGFA
jgi:probable F420-dependent oxidoreductase